MNKKIGIILATSALACVLATGSTLALWSDVTEVTAGDLETGGLEVKLAGAAVWTETSADVPEAPRAITLADFRAVPGDTLVSRQAGTTARSGDNLTAELSVTVPKASDPRVTTTYSVLDENQAAVPGALDVRAGKTVTIPVNALPGGGFTTEVTHTITGDGPLVGVVSFPGAQYTFSQTGVEYPWVSETAATAQELPVAAQSYTVNGEQAAARVPADAMKALDATAPQAFSIGIEGVSEGNAGLNYTLNLAEVSGDTGLVGVTTAIVTARSEGECTPGAEIAGERVYEGPLGGIVAETRPLVGVGPASPTGAVSLCVQLSVPAGHGDYASSATVTADSAGGTVSASTEWFGRAIPSPAAQGAVVALPIAVVSTR